MILQLDDDHLAAEFLARIDKACPELHDPAQQLLSRLVRRHWPLEWGLPAWLSETLALPAAFTERLVLFNLFGLAYVRAQDDIADAEAPEATRSVTLCLANFCFEQALLLVLPLFDRSSEFWPFLEARLAEWISATLESSGLQAAPGDPLSVEHQAALARRAAPIKICCAASCLYAGRPDLLPTYTAMLDPVMAAMVLLDHFGDWRADLEAGRYNAFIAYASGLPQTPANRETNRQRVLHEFFLGHRAVPYFDVLRGCLHRGIEMSTHAGVGGLAGYLLELEAEAMTYRERVESAARVLLDAAAHLALEPDSFESGTERRG